LQAGHDKWVVPGSSRKAERLLFFHGASLCYNIVITIHERRRRVPMSVTDQIVANVIETDFASLPSECVERAKWRVIDSIGCLTAGSGAAGIQGAVDLVKKWGGAPEATVLTHAVKVPAPHAAFVNSLMTRSYDFEAVEAEGETRSSPAHISGTTVPTALTMAEYRAASGKDLITALVLGDDLTSRLSLASGFDFGAGWCNTGTINGFGATAIACKLLRLNTAEVSNAFGIVLNQLGGTMDNVWDKVMAFKLPMALASRAGIFSAELAASGFRGAKDPFLGKFGYFTLYCSNADPSSLAKDLGKKFYADRVIKPYSACRATHGAIDSALQISRNNDVAVDDIESITVHVTPGVLNGFTGTTFLPGETPQIDAAFSVRFTVATALLRKDVKPAYFAEECLKDPAIESLIAKMTLVATVPQEKSPSTRIDVKMKNGSTLSGANDFPKGDIYRTPMTKDEIRTKFRDNVASSRRVPTDRAEEALQMLETLQDVADIREVIRLIG
jgi:2-methylcitrate dehydratase PrpD